MVTPPAYLRPWRSFHKLAVPHPYKGEIMHENRTGTDTTRQIAHGKNFPTIRRMLRMFMKAPLWRILALVTLLTVWISEAPNTVPLLGLTGLILNFAVVIFILRLCYPIWRYYKHPTKMPYAYYLECVKDRSRARAGRMMLKDSVCYGLVGLPFWAACLTSVVRGFGAVMLAVLAGGLSFWAIYCFFAGIGRLQESHRNRSQVV
jgi:hypothetical protein